MLKSKVLPVLKLKIFAFWYKYDGFFRYYCLKSITTSTLTVQYCYNHLGNKNIGKIELNINLSIKDWLK